MVIDKIENHKIYTGLGSRIKLAFDYIMKTDLVQTPLGQYEIDGDDVFAIVMEYDTKDKSETKFEGHHKYIDLQYIISGTELIGITTLIDQVPVESSTENDYDLYDIDGDFIKFDSGTFMLFFPDDLHMPAISVNQVSKIKKVVVKVRV
jgi:YhcH/YjgK/YiaL family protein